MLVAVIDRSPTSLRCTLVDSETGEVRARLAEARLDEDEDEAITLFLQRAGLSAEAIAEVTAQLEPRAPMSIPIAISARHVHLTVEAVEALFGEGHRLTPNKPLSQPGQFAANEKVTVIGPRRSIEGVRAIGPERRANQVEVSRTDEFHLGLDAPIRDSGDVAGSPAITLVGPAGSLELSEGVICARRHIHMTPEDADALGVSDQDVVEVEVDTEGRDLVFGDVLVRVKPTYALELHIDTDEANAAEIVPGSEGVLAATEWRVRVR